MSMLEIRDLQVEYAAPQKGRRIVAVDGVSFDISEGETVGLVGESGSGKSTLGLTILGLASWKGARVKGGIRWMGQSLEQNDCSWQKLRGVAIGYVPQEPQAALNPYLTCGSQIMESWARGSTPERCQRQARVVELLSSVELDPGVANKYPHQLSGGMCQRVLLAAALANNPPLLIADEPTAAVDKITQKRLLRLLEQIRQTHNMACLFISHDLLSVAHLSDRVLVMYQGKVVEEGDARDILSRPKHSYTISLLQAAREGWL